MQRIYRISLLTLLLLCLNLFIVSAQVNYEIRATSSGVAEVTVQLRATSLPCPLTSDYVTDIVFGLKWPALVNFDLPNFLDTEYNMKKAGVRGTKSGYFFQAFYSDPVGFHPANGWLQNEWVNIAKIPNLAGAGVTTIEICEPNFDITTDPNLAINFIDYTPAINGSATGIVLPVVFLNFDATYKKDHILVQWQTSTEINAKDFQVQRSVDGNSFHDIHILQASGNSTTARGYEFKDEQVIQNYRGKAVFYRIVQNDKGGQSQYTGIKKVMIPGVKNTLKLAYNAVSKEAMLLYDCLQNDRVLIRVTDVGGRLVYKKEISVVMGNNQIVIPVSNLADGMYTVDVTGKFDRQNVSMLKQ